MPVDETQPVTTSIPGTCITRRRLMLASVGGALLAVGSASAREATPSPDGSPATKIGDPDAIATLTAAAAAMAALDTFTFDIESVQGESTILQGLTLGAIHGVVRRPTDFSATVTLILPFGSLSVTAVGVGNTAWIQNPLEQGTWIPLEGTTDVVALVNPDTLILAAVGIIDNVALDGTEKVDGMEMTRVAGTLDLSALAPTDDPGATSLLSTEPIDIVLWIDDQHLIHEIELDGPLMASESADVVRVVRFYNFNEPVDIATPQV